jgi:hypothetical protein
MFPSLSPCLPLLLSLLVLASVVIGHCVQPLSAAGSTCCEDVLYLCVKIKRLPTENQQSVSPFTGKNTDRYRLRTDTTQSSSKDQY